ncbi:MAG: translocation/assembly module TamB domain-containing protein, partial [Candidatus Zixiibacteriota bacterium]
MKTNPTRHRILRYSLYVVTAVVVLVVLAIVVALLPPGQKLIKDELESFVSSRLDQEVTIGSFETNLFSHASLSDIRVSSKAESDSTTIALVDNFFIDYSLWPLIHKEFAIKSILIDTVRLQLKRDTSGFFSLIVLDTLPSKSTFTVTLGSVLLQSLSLEYRDRMTPLTGSLRGASIVTENVDSLQGYAFSIAADSGSMQYDTLPAEPVSLTLRGLYSPDVWLLDTLLVRMGGLLMAGHARVAQINNEAPIDADLSVQGDPRTAFNILAAQYGITDIDIQGDLQSRITVSGTTASPRGKASLDLPTVTIRGVEAIGGTASVRLEQDSLLVDSMDISVFDGHLTASGYMALDTLKANAVVSLNGVELSSIWRTFRSGPSPYKGSLHANVTVGGSGRKLDGWKVDGSLNVKRAQYKSESLSDLNADFGLEKGILTTALRQEYINLSAKVDLNRDTVAGRLNLAISDLSPLAGIVGQPQLAGALEADITLSGTREMPRLQAHASGNNMKYRDFPVDTLALQVVYADTSIFVRQLLFSGEFDAAEVAAAPFGLSSLEGNYSYSGKASGPLDRLKGDLTISAVQPGYGSLAFDSAVVDLYVDLPVIRLDTLDLYKSAVAVRSQARFNLDSSRGEVTARLYDKSAKHDGSDTAALGYIHASLVRTTTDTLAIDARASEIDLAAFRTLWPDTIDIAGTLSLNTQFTLAGAVPRGELSLSVAGPRYEDIKLDSATARVSVSSDSLDISTLNLYSSEQQLTANAYLALSTDAGGSPTITRSSAVEGAIHGSDLRLKGLEPFLPGEFSLEGTSSLDLKWHGTISDPNLRGSIDLSDVSLVASEDSVLSEFTLAASVTDSVIAFDTAAGKTYSTPFTLGGSAIVKSLSEVQTDLTMTVADVATITARGTASRKNIDFTAVIDSLNLAVLMPLIPDFDTLSGTLDANLTIKGNPTAPDVRGSLEVDSGFARPKSIDEQISGAIARITFTPDTVRIDTLSAKVGKGTMSVKGVLAHSGMTITDIKTTATARNIKITDKALFSATIDSADVGYGSKDNDRYLLSGTVALGEAKLTKNLDYASILPWANKAKQVTPNVPAPLDRTDFDLKILGGDSLWVDNNLARMRLSADVTFIGSISRPNLTGRVMVEKGYVLYLDRKFNVQQGVLYFSDPNEINPDINLLAQANITTYQASQPMSYVVSVSVTGNLDNPVITLSSEPPL